MSELVLDEPVIILTSARSGSTLLRLILDAHPDFACPPETNIIKICSQLAAVFSVTGEPGDGEQAAGPAQEAINTTLTMVFGDYLAQRGKSRWCDKSLGTAPVAEWFLRLYPKAKFICLYRHCMDVIYSGLEASPWGLMGYGFEQFAGTRSGNSVSALSAYWIEHTGRIIEFEKANSDRCIRVRYESLVGDPERTAAEIFSFLGADPVPGITSSCFTPDMAAPGPGDYKIRATRKITADSVGRGIRVPMGMIPPPQLMVINHLLAELDYTPVDDAWQRSACPPVLLRDNGVEGAGPAGQDQAASFGDRVVRSVLENIGEVIRTRVLAGFIQHLPSIGLPSRDGSRTFGLVAYHGDHHRMARSWLIDLESQQLTPVAGASGRDLRDVDWLVTGDVETWLGILADRLNMAACLRSGALRYVALGDKDRQASEIPESDLSGVATMERRLLVIRGLLGIAGYPEEVAGPALVG